jgi:hypothetical protein
MFSKKKVKAQYEITIKSAQWTFGYTKLAGKVMHVEWKRGDKVRYLCAAFFLVFRPFPSSSFFFRHVV